MLDTSVYGVVRNSVIQSGKETPLLSLPFGGYNTLPKFIIYSVRLLLIISLCVAPLISAGQLLYGSFTANDSYGIFVQEQNEHYVPIYSDTIVDGYEYIEPFYLGVKRQKHAKKHYYVFAKNGKMGVFNALGEVQIPATMDTISVLRAFIGEAQPRRRDFFQLERGDSVWLQSCKDLKVIVEPGYDSIQYYGWDGLIYCFKAGRIHLHDLSGTKLFPSNAFDTLYSIRKADPENIAVIASEPGTKAKLYDQKGTYPNSSKYELRQFMYSRGGFDNYLIHAIRNDKWGILDSDGKVFIDFKYDQPLVHVDFWDDSEQRHYQCWAFVVNNKEGLMDFQGNTIHPAEYLPGSFSKNKVYRHSKYFLVCKGDEDHMGVVDGKGNVVIPVQKQDIASITSNSNYQQPYFQVNRDGLKGIYDWEGNVIHPCVYYAIEDENRTKYRKSAPSFVPLKTKEDYDEYWRR